MANSEKLNIYFGCSDPFGENKPEEIFYENILPVLRKNSLSDNDVDAVAQNIREMIERAYSNGQDSESFDREDVYYD